MPSSAPVASDTPEEEWYEDAEDEPVPDSIAVPATTVPLAAARQPFWNGLNPHVVCSATSTTGFMSFSQPMHNNEPMAPIAAPFRQAGLYERRQPEPTLPTFGATSHFMTASDAAARVYQQAPAISTNQQFVFTGDTANYMENLAQAANPQAPGPGNQVLPPLQGVGVFNANALTAAMQQQAQAATAAALGPEAAQAPAPQAGHTFPNITSMPGTSSHIPLSRSSRVKMPMPEMFDGTKKGLDARDWLDTVQTFWDYAFDTDQGRVNIIVSRLTDDAKRWFDHELGTIYGRTGMSCPTSKFVDAFAARYITDQTVHTARQDFYALKQGNMGTAEYKDKFTAALHLVALVPGGCPIDPTTAVTQYVQNLKQSVRNKMMAFWNESYISNLDATMALSLHCTQLLNAPIFQSQFPGTAPSRQTKRSNDTWDWRKRKTPKTTVTDTPQSAPPDVQLPHQGYVAQAQTMPVQGQLQGGRGHQPQQAHGQRGGRLGGRGGRHPQRMFDQFLGVQEETWH